MGWWYLTWRLATWIATAECGLVYCLGGCRTVLKVVACGGKGGGGMCRVMSMRFRAACSWVCMWRSWGCVAAISMGEHCSGVVAGKGS